ncbi:hypothetical protein R9C00_12205 [Flammeovirgaceae bacterium SG7u.111]|nr:hypothetical protein [Flammeovirgaceae bacterium SG7u.132]WPO38216.1 hypothetical protein R9C00_12205 [Flammeovirgaceae bacterium SG7u.111]
MKNKVIVLLSVFTLFFANASFAQFEPFSDGAKMLSAGVGATGWGIPVYVRYEQAIVENVTIGGSLSYQSYSEKYSGGKWRHTIFGVSGRGSYHFNELFSAAEEWDFYAGGSLGFYSWDTKWDDASSPTFDYNGSGSGGMSIGAHVGVRYFLNEKIGLNAEVGGGTVLAGATVGVTFLL